MAKIDSRRRSFLKSSTGAIVLAALGQINQSFSASLEQESSKNNTFQKREHYLVEPGVSYLNHASVGTIPKALQKVHFDYLNLCETNPSRYMWSEPWEIELAKTRNRLANFINCDSNELAFTHNTTEGFNLLAQGLNLRKNDEVLFSSLNHAGASECWNYHSRTFGYSVRKFEFPLLDLPMLSDTDIVDLYSKQISENTRVLIIPHIDNIVGLIHPIEAIAKMARRKGVEFIAVDGAQMLGMNPVDVKQLGVDFYACSGHKWLQGPKGTGILYVKQALQSKLKAMWVTWGQSEYTNTARVFEDYGTRNLAAILTLGHAVVRQEKIELQNSIEVRTSLRKYAMALVETSDKLKWCSSKHDSLSSSVFTLDVGQQNSKILATELFNRHGIVVRSFQSNGYNRIRISPNFTNLNSELEKVVRLIS